MTSQCSEASRPLLRAVAAKVVKDVVVVAAVALLWNSEVVSSEIHYY